MLNFDDCATDIDEPKTMYRRGELEERVELALRELEDCCESKR